VPDAGPGAVRGGQRTIGEQPERTWVAAQHQHRDAGPQHGHGAAQDPVDAQRVLGVLKHQRHGHARGLQLGQEQLQALVVHPPVRQRQQRDRSRYLHRALQHQPQADQVTLGDVPGIGDDRGQAQALLAADPVRVERLGRQLAPVALIPLPVRQ
jgi:hypothetical protein